MKVLIIGLGSIGKRHCSNLISLGVENISIVTSKKELPDSFKHLIFFTSIAAAVENETYTHALICTPTANHLSDLQQLIEAGIPQIYLEKPISNTLSDVSIGLEYIEKGNQIIVGYDLHFDPGLNRVKSLLDNNAIGRVYSVNSFVGQYLPDWRPYEDYRLGMSASIEKGGGVMLDLIHEFDYLCWLFGTPETVYGMYQNNPELEIETEDLADILVKFQKGINVSLHLDYHQRSLVRNCLITGEKGSILWDLADRKVTFTNDQKEVEIFDFNGYERNDRYLQILDAFLNNPSDPRLCTYPMALKSLELVIAAKMSSEFNSVVQLPISI